MKNILKYLSVLCAALGLLLLVSCPNPLEFDNISSGAKSGIRIVISGEGVGARTLFPSAPNFTKFEISFENINGQSTYNTIVLDAGKSEVTIDDLPVDTKWKITAKGFITINGNFIQAADGEAIIDVLPWENGKTTFQSVNIPISARQKSGENGTFHYDIDFPGSVNTAELFIYNIGGSPWEVQPTSILTKKTDNISLAPGYYMVTMRFNNGYKTVAWTEVIHIYSNTVTEMVKVFDESLILGIITLSGKASILIDGVKPDNASVYIYSDAKYTNLFNNMEAKYGSKVNSENTGELFPISMPVFDEPITFYLKIYAEIGKSVYSRELGFFKLYKDDYVFNINENFETITLSGTSDVKINGYNPREVSIWAYRADNNELLTVNSAEVDLSPGKNGSWKMTFESFKSQIQVYFIVEAISMDRSYYYKRADVTVTAFKTNIADIFIEIDVGLLTVSGTADITVNNAAPRWGQITMRKMAGGEVGDWLSTSEIDFKNGNTWVNSLNYLTEQIEVYFEYECEDAGNNYYHGIVIDPVTKETFTMTLSNANVADVALVIGNISAITIEGTANIIVKGGLPQKAEVAMYRTSDNVQFGYSQIDLQELFISSEVVDGEEKEVIETNPNFKKWKMVLFPAFTAPTSVYFVIYGVDSEGNIFRRNALTRTVHNQSISGIELNVTINAIEITLSGTINLSHNIKAPDNNEVEITALIQDGAGNYSNQIGSTLVTYAQGSRNWSMNIMSFGASTSVRFRIRWSIDGETFFIFPESVTASVYESDVSGINLGERALDPTYIFNKNEGSENWTANINPAWLGGIAVQAGEYYALDFTFTSRVAIIELDAVMRDFTISDYNDSLLSDIRRVESNIDARDSLTGTIVFTVNKSASITEDTENNTFIANNTIHFIAAANTQPVLTFSKLVVRKLAKQGSLDKWTVSTNAANKDLTIVGPGITTTANIVTYGGRDNVLYVMQGSGGYYHFVIEYDLSPWKGKSININISFDYQLTIKESPPSRVSWRITSVPESPQDYPLVCQGSSSQNSITSWTNVSGNYTMTVPNTPGFDGKKLYLSSYELTDAEVYFSNFTLTINEQ